VLEFMSKLAAGPYHPAVQINAMLMIGELNGVEGPPPIPLPNALDVMLAAVNNTKVSEAVRAVAMVGIQRHVAAKAPDDDTRRTLTAAMLKLAAADPAAGAGAGREWILAQALETLGRLGSVGENNAAFKTMLKAVSDAKISFSTRTIAAESLGRLNYAGVAGINPVAAAAVLGQFAIDACTEEIRLTKQTEYPVSRRRMKQRLGAVLLALNGGDEENPKGIASLAGDKTQQTFVGALQKDIASLTSVLDDNRRKDDDLQDPVEKLRSTLEAWLKKKG
jgi:hypothetical protein